MDNLLLGVNTTVIGMGIVFLVLIALYYIVKLESSIFNRIGKAQKSVEKPAIAAVEPSYADFDEDVKKGSISGKMVVSGVDDDQELAAIMAVVSRDTNVPLKQLKFKSIRRI